MNKRKITTLFRAFRSYLLLFSHKTNLNFKSKFENVLFRRTSLGIFASQILNDMTLNLMTHLWSAVIKLSKSLLTYENDKLILIHSDMRSWPVTESLEKILTSI